MIARPNDEVLITDFKSRQDWYGKHLKPTNPGPASRLPTRRNFLQVFFVRPNRSEPNGLQMDSELVPLNDIAHHCNLIGDYWRKFGHFAWVPLLEIQLATALQDKHSDSVTLSLTETEAIKLLEHLECSDNRPVLSAISASIKAILARYPQLDWRACAKKAQMECNALRLLYVEARELLGEADAAEGISQANIEALRSLLRRVDKLQRRLVKVGANTISIGSSGLQEAADAFLKAGRAYRAYLKTNHRDKLHGTIYVQNKIGEMALYTESAMQAAAIKETYLAE